MNDREKLLKRPSLKGPGRRRAVYAISGDPIHKGHLDIIHRAASLFEEVIVALGARVRDALPPRPGKTIILTWPINDPTTLLEPSAAAFESAFQSLESNIRDLAGAILEEPKQEQEKPHAKSNPQ